MTPPSSRASRRGFLASDGLLAAALCLLAAGSVPAQGFHNTNRSYLGKALPDIDSEGASWINASKGLSLKALRNGPTLVCFTFLG